MRAFIVGFGTLVLLALALEAGSYWAEAPVIVASDTTPIVPVAAPADAKGNREFVSLCRVYHTMTLGSGLCYWYLIPQGCTGSPAGELNYCDSAFGSCNCMKVKPEDCPHCSDSWTVDGAVAIHQAAARPTAEKTEKEENEGNPMRKPLPEKGASKHSGKVTANHGSETKVLPGMAPTVVRFKYGPVKIIAHLFPMKTQPNSGDPANPHEEHKFFVGRQIVDVAEKDIDENISPPPEIKEINEKRILVKYNCNWYDVILQEDEEP